MGERYMFSTKFEDRFSVGDVIPFMNRRYEITAVVWNKHNEVWDIYGKPV